MLKFSKEEVVGTAKVEIDLTAYDVETIMVNGLEGGIGYWAMLNNTGKEWGEKPKSEPASTWATKILLDGGEIRFFDSEEYDEDSDDNEVWTLTLEGLIKGFAQNHKQRPWDNDLEQGDATTADCIIQYGVFGKLVFG